jgi:hypothetical protein
MRNAPDFQTCLRSSRNWSTLTSDIDLLGERLASQHQEHHEEHEKLPIEHAETPHLDRLEGTGPIHTGRPSH